MKNLLESMKISPLFSGIEEDMLKKLIDRLEICVHSKQRGGFLLHQGDRAPGIGLVVSGRLHIVREDFLGNREILAEVAPGEIFDEVYGILPEEPQRVAVVAEAESTAAFFSMDRLMEAGGECPTLVENLIRVLAQKNLFLTTKMAHLTRRTIREKVISYLSEESSRQGSRDIRIPFNRQQLADYLSVERSALSRELSRMKEEKLIDYRANRFILL